MINHDRWAAFAARIHGLMTAARLHATLLGVRSSDSYGRGKHLGESFHRLRADLIAFQTTSDESFPQPALAVLKNFIRDTEKLCAENNGTSELREERTQALLLKLATFETEMTYVLSDDQEFIRSRTDRAFEHLKRLITVDPGVRGQWQAAFRAGEVECEKLGAVHLLWHGIWAFKAHAPGARTDLVLQEPIGDLRLVQQAAEGLVLTEWKTAHGENVSSVIEQARLQARAYSHGLLAGFELTRYRYVVVVSERQVPIPEDLNEGSVTFRHVNVAVDPVTPSREAKLNA